MPNRIRTVEIANINDERSVCARILMRSRASSGKSMNARTRCMSLLRKHGIDELVCTYRILITYLSPAVTWDVKRSSRFKRKPRNYRSSEAQTRYYVSTKRFSCRRTLNLRSSCIDRKNTAFGHLEGFRPSDSLCFPSRSMPFGQISYVFRARMTHACRHLRNL
jgi:hypothetical protein